MLTVQVRLLEFMDSSPFAACEVSISARVLAGWKKRVFVDSPAGVPRPQGPPPSVVFTDFDDSRAIAVQAQARTNAQGRADVALNLSSAFAQAQALRRDDLPPVAIVAELSASADVFGMALAADYRFRRVETPDGTVDVVLIADAARSIVGDTSSEHTTLWFQLSAAAPRESRLVCVLRPKSAAAGADRRVELVFDPDRDHTATTVLRGLAAATPHFYELRLALANGTEHVLTRGSVRTLPANPQRLTIAFASCHRPNRPAALDRWAALAAREDVDLGFLMGDQIYGDDIEKQFPALSWNERYERRYRQLWAYQPVRNVLRSRPTFMTLDDHEVVDDWGVEPVDEDREAAGLRAYRIFQQAHNPGGFGATTLDYSFTLGPAAFMVTDSRSARGKDTTFPVMGRAQHQRLLTWSRSPAVQSADLVFVVVPVPPAMVPIAQLEKLASLLAAPAGAVGVGLLGVLAGAAIGFAVGGPVGAVIGAQIGGASGAFVGGVGAKVVYEHLENTIKDPDIRDAWTYDKNLPDLVRLLDVLFDVANDIGADGRPGPRPKGVFILSGDYHFGAIHRILSSRRGNGHDHRNNPAIVQITSSPISIDAIDAELLLKAASIVSTDKAFKLDDDHYQAQFVGHLEQRNFGRVSFERVAGAGRRYRIQMYIEGERDALAELFELNLDARPVQMRNLIGELLAASGRLTMLRVQDPGGGFGPATDRIDGEVVITLDTEPGRAFGFQLRPDVNLPVRQRMLALLRDAFVHDKKVAIDYLRTGQHNGTLIRVSELPAPAPSSPFMAMNTLVTRSF